MSITNLLLIFGGLCILFFCIRSKEQQSLFLIIRKATIVVFLVGLGIVIGYFKYHNGAPRIEPRLVFAMQYLYTYQAEHNKFPSEEEFKKWVKNNYDGWGFEYMPSDNYKAYIIGAWEGDTMQYFNSTTKKLSYKI